MSQVVVSNAYCVCSVMAVNGAATGVPALHVAAQQCEADKAAFLERMGGVAGAYSTTAVDDNVALAMRLQFGGARGQLFVRDVDGASDVAAGVFNGGADIEQHGRLRGIQTAEQVIGGDLR